MLTQYSRFFNKGREAVLFRTNFGGLSLMILSFSIQFSQAMACAFHELVDALVKETNLGSCQVVTL